LHEVWRAGKLSRLCRDTFHEMTTPQISVVQRLRKSPFYDATVRWGARTFTVYNHMLMPTCFASPEADYWKLVTETTLWDVSAERQVEIIGEDAYIWCACSRPVISAGSSTDNASTRRSSTNAAV